jgi:hypothetical protein
VAKILYVSGDWQASDRHIPWAIASVEHRLWGLPWWASQFVLLGHVAAFKKGAEYFIDGDRSGYRIATFLPYVDFRCGNRTTPLSEAVLDMRLIRDGPPKSGVRVVGRTLRLSSDGRHYPAGGITVKISGPNGTISTVSDPHAVYDVNGLPPGHYTVTSDAADDADAFYKEYYEMRESDLRSGNVWGRDVLTR